MIWILVVILVGMVVVLAQLLLAYQKRAVRMRVAMNPVRKQIESHRERLTEIAANTRSMADEGLAQLKKDMAGFTRRSGHAANVVAELDSEAQAMSAEMARQKGEDPDEVAEEEEEEGAGTNGEEEGLEAILGGRKDPSMRVEADRIDPVELVRSIRRDLEETYEYMESLRTDATIVKQTAQRAGPGDRNGQQKDRGGDA